MGAIMATTNALGINPLATRTIGIPADIRKTYTNITPFTIRDGQTYLESLESIKYYISNTLVRHLDEQYMALASAWIAEVDALIEAVNNGFDAQEASIEQRFKDLVTKIDASLGSALEIGRRIVVASIDRFPDIDPLGIAASGVGLTKAFAATPDGGTLIIPPGTYLIDRNIMVNQDADKKARNLNVTAYGAKFILTSNETMFSARGNWDDTLPVASVTSVNMDELTAEYKKGLSIVTAVASPYKRGDIVKLFADNVIDGARPGANGLESRVGQFFEVFSVSGFTTVLAGVPRHLFTSSVRVARMQNKTVTWAGGEIDVADAAFDNVSPWSASIFGFSNLMMPTIKDVVIRRNASIIINMVSCYGYVVDNVDQRYARNDPTGSIPRFGYGIMDNCSESGRTTNCRFHMVRHAWSDDTPRIAVNTDNPSQYGGTFNAKVTGNIADTTSSSGFDTHHHSEDTTFLNNTVLNAQAAFSLRGKRHKVIGNTAYDCQFVINHFTESGGGTSVNHVIENNLGVRINVAGYRSYINPTGHPQAGIRDMNPTFVKGLRLLDSVGTLFTTLNNRVLFTDCYAEFAAVLPAGHYGTNIRNSDITEERTILDYSKWTAGSPLSYQFHDAEASVHRSRGLRQIGSPTGVINRAVESLTTSLIQFDDASYDKAPTSFGQDCADGSWLDYRCGTLSSAQIALVGAPIALDDGAILNMGRTRIPTLLLECVNTTGAVLTLGKLPAGQFRGQILVITNRGTSTANVSLTSAAASKRLVLASGTARVLAPGQSLMAQYSAENSAWRHINLVP